MKEKLIMNTVYNVLMDEGYRPKKEKPCPEETFLTFKAQGRPLLIPTSGDNYIAINMGVTMPYYKKFGRIDLYSLVSNYNCMQVEGIKYVNNKESLFFILRFL